MEASMKVVEAIEVIVHEDVALREPKLCIEDMERACSPLERRLDAPEVGAVAIRPVMDEPRIVLPPPPVIPPVTPRASPAVLRPLTPAVTSSVASDEIRRRRANNRRVLR